MRKCQAIVGKVRCKKPVAFRMTYRIYGTTHGKALCRNHRDSIRQKEGLPEFDCAVYSEVKV